MLWLRAHVAAVGIVALALVTAAGAFTFARPKAHPFAEPPTPHTPLPYTKATYSARDAERAFRAADIKLVRHTPDPVPVGNPPIIDLSNGGNIVEVGVFGDPRRVAASGFSDYFIFAHGHWVKAPKTCSGGAKAAERWSGNVRVIVDCTAAGASAPAWVARVDRALAKLS
jgi:hypothetical protein